MVSSIAVPRGCISVDAASHSYLLQSFAGPGEVAMMPVMY